MQQRLVVVALVLGMIVVGPVWADEVLSPTVHRSWFESVCESVVSFLSNVEKDGEIDPNHEIDIPPIGWVGEDDPNFELDHGPVIEPSGQN